MAIIKGHICKSCGGPLDIDIDRQLYICPFCGVTYDYDYFREDNVMAIAEFEKKPYPIHEGEDHCILVNPSNMGNIGTIIRCMVGFSLFDLVRAH